MGCRYSVFVSSADRSVEAEFERLTISVLFFSRAG